MPNLEKNKQIKEKGIQTKLRHKSMCCRFYTLKIKENKLNCIQRESLERYFLCSKWIYNYIISNIDDIFNFNYHSYPILTHKDKDGEDISIKVSDYLPAQFYQQIGKDIQSSIKTLSSRKKKGFKVGKLKCKSSCNCISINQYKTGYQLYPSCNSIHIAGIKKDIKAAVKAFRSNPDAKTLAKAQSEYDKAVKKNLLKKNTASRRKAKLYEFAKAAGVKLETLTKKAAPKTTLKATANKKTATTKKAPAKKTQSKAKKEA